MSRSTSSAFPSLPEAAKPLQTPGGRKELTHRRRRPRTPLQPGEGLLLIKGQCCGLLERIVDPDALDDAAIPWGSNIRHHNPKDGPLVGSDPLQPEPYGHPTTSLSQPMDPTLPQREYARSLPLFPRLEHLSHQSLGLLKLPQKLVHLRHRCPGPLGNALTPAPIQDRRVALFLPGHGIQNGLHPGERPAVRLQAAHPRGEAREHPQDLLDRPHPSHLDELFAKVLECIRIPLDLSRQLLSPRPIHRGLCPLHQGQDIAPPEDPRGHPFWMKRLRRGQPFPNRPGTDLLTPPRPNHRRLPLPGPPHPAW